MTRWRTAAAKIKEEVAVYRRVLRHPRTPLPAKALPGFAVGYLLLPFDVIPDFIPLLGASSMISLLYRWRSSWRSAWSPARSSVNAGKK